MEEKLKVLLVGGGGREHAIASLISQSPSLGQLYCAPGNSGTLALGENLDIKADDVKAILEFAQEAKIDFVIVAPDDPLALGLVDLLEAEGILAFGPRAKAAKIEASKSFAKELMQKYEIPTAAYRAFNDYDQARDYVSQLDYPLVIKADGLALGKGVVIAQNYLEAEQAIRNMLLAKRYGQAGSTVVIEEFLEGEELTLLCFCDGSGYSLMPTAKDHKKALDGNLGENTGGMGVISPANCDQADLERIEREIVRPSIKALKKEDRLFQGVLYFGLILSEDGPKVIEYNARFGDPEAQAILPLLKTDLLSIMLKVAQNQLASIEILWQDKASCTVVMASAGYPREYKTGFEIKGLDQLSDAKVFHAGMRRANSKYYTNGGRVLALTALGPTVKEARAKVYAEIKKLSFKSSYYRKDIGV